MRTAVGRTGRIVGAIGFALAGMTQWHEGQRTLLGGFLVGLALGILLLPEVIPPRG